MYFFDWLIVVTLHRNRNFSPLQRRSLAKFGSLMLLAVVMLAVAHESADHSTVAKSLVMVLYLLPAFPIMLMVRVVSQYLTRETDEFIRLLVMRSLLWGIGTTMVADTLLAAVFSDPRALRLAVVFNIDVFTVTAMIALSLQLRRAQ
jgi:hypothetical protein